ncbi:MAG: hypothetical protein JWL77_6974 [Chthonomonadaceae bacterium]|nr:hypothetical protein [Chthonomonadaceae bacterium]
MAAPAREQPCLAAHLRRLDLAFEEVVVQADRAVFEVARQRLPAVQAVVNRPGGRSAIGNALSLKLQPLVQVQALELGFLAGAVTKAGLLSAKR